ncbi:DNA-binding protein [Mycolicibacterium septicum]|nr:DNA-binding protein [Mycolicibacterium septicum]MDT0523869.1 DNA-binding protein [Streptomyces sp. DSM 41633]
MTNGSLQPPNPSRERAHRQYAGLFRIAERHADTAERRARSSNAHMVEPHEAVRIVAALAGGTFSPEPGEPDIDEDDLMAALTLMPKVRLDLDELEALLLLAAHRRGFTWQRIAFGLGLGSAQAARQRYERLVRRTG